MAAHPMRPNGLLPSCTAGASTWWRSRERTPSMRDEVGDLGVAVLRAVKATLDPAGILNPGKLIP